MERYKNGKIYTIRSNQTDKFYLGSTCLELYKRLYSHRANYKAYQKDNNKNYITSFKILQYEDHYIELLEEFPCNNKMELEKREGELIRQHLDNLVNKNINRRTFKEYKEDNKNKIKEQNKKYRQDNKDKINKKIKQWIETNKEKLKQYREDNKDKIKQYQKDNKNKIKINREKRNILIICECGSKIKKEENKNHLKTKKHINYINNIDALPSDT